MSVSSTFSPTPSPVKKTVQEAYIDFTSGSHNQWAQQYLPDLMEKEAEVFGNRTISGFLEMVGAEEAMAADQVIWSEQSRLHLAYKGSTDDTGSTIWLTADSSGSATNDIYTGGGSAIGKDHGVRAGDMILVASHNATRRCYVSAVDGTTGQLTVDPYIGTNLTVAAGGGAIVDHGGGAEGAANVRVLVYGSEHRKGANGRASGNEAKVDTRANNPIIMKDKYSVSGSDASQIGWIEVTGEEGQNGYLWYLKSEGDTRARFTDYCEMALIESAPTTAVTSQANPVAGALKGTEGLFYALENRGNVATGVLGASEDADLTEFDLILAEFDKNGAIEENMMFLARTPSLAIDDMLAAKSAYGAGGTSYGVFDNSEDMALNLGFNGFRRGSYDFYKTDWKYLNDQGTRGWINGALDLEVTSGVLQGTYESTPTADAGGLAGGLIGGIRGVIVPAGVTSVYDQMLGKNLKRPFLHTRFRASQTEDRRFKTWITGSVGAVTSDLDAMEVHYLTERCLIVQGANNFMLLN